MMRRRKRRGGGAGEKKDERNEKWRSKGCDGAGSFSFIV